MKIHRQPNGRRGAFVLASALVVGTVLAAPSAATASDNSVVAIDWAEFTAGNPTDAQSVTDKAILTNAIEYAVNTWYNTVKDYDSQGGTYLDFGGTGETQIRPPAAESVALAVALATGVYDATATGVSEVNATAIAVKLIRSLAYRHLVNNAGGWGNSWQTAAWASNIGLAGWLLWDDLNSTDREYIRKMVEYEANRFNNYTVPYYRNGAGTIISAGDSKGEENSWNAQLLSLATAMMPAHQNWTVWMDKNVELLISAFSRPEDVGGSTVVNGKPLSAWLNGSNINSDGTMVNHSIIHPDYMSTITQNALGGVVYTLGQQATPEAAFFNADRVFDALVDLNFTAPPYLSPGGTVYIDGTSNIYYPQGNDWGTGRRMQFVTTDAMADAFAFDGLASQDGAYWEGYHAQKALDMQNRFTDGHTYLNTSEDDYSGREEWVAALAGVTYLTKWIKHQGGFSITTQGYATGPTVVSEGKTATASSTYSSTYAASKAFDGNISGTRWAAVNATKPQWLKVDLGGAYNISEVKTYFEWPAKWYKYKVEYSLDDSTWSTFVDKTSNTVAGNPAYIDTGSGVGRYVRITVTDAESNSFASIFEMQVSGTAATTLLSQGHTATASSIYSATYAASKGFDGNTSGTRWAAVDATKPQWLKVDLGAAYTVSQIKTYFEWPAKWYKYKIEYSLNDSTWSTFVDKTSNTVAGNPAYVDNGSVVGRYIRITVTDAESSSFASIWEMQVYGY